jgi:hypothetical protein
MSGFPVPTRYQVRLNEDFQPDQPVQVEAHMLPTGVFGVQDGRTPRRADDSATMAFDKKTGDFFIQGRDGKPIELDPVSLEGVSLRIGWPISIQGNVLVWTQPGASTADAAIETIAASIHGLCAMLPLLSYRRRAPISILKILAKQNEQLVGWAELPSVTMMVWPYKRELIEEELASFDSWFQTIPLDTALWWAMVYWDRAIRHQEVTPFVDDSYAEVIINFWKAAETILETWHCKQVRTRAKRLGLSDTVAEELVWLCDLRHSDDVAHTAIRRKRSAEQLEELYAGRSEKVRRAGHVAREIIDHALKGAPAKQAGK